MNTIEKWQKYNRERYHKLKELGQCPGCKKPPGEGRVWCKKCVAKIGQLCRAKTASRRGLGLCCCGKLLVENRKHCSTCLAEGRGKPIKTCKWPGCSAVIADSDDRLNCSEHCVGSAAQKARNRELTRKSFARRRQERKRLGLCYYCSAPASEYRGKLTTRCEKHHAINRAVVARKLSRDVTPAAAKG